MTAKAVGWDLLAKRVSQEGDEAEGVDVDQIRTTVENVKQNTLQKEKETGVREYTKRNLEKVLKFRGDDAVLALTEKAGLHMVCTLLSHFTLN